MKLKIVFFSILENSLQQQQQHRLTSTTFVSNGSHFSASNCSSQLTNTSKFPNTSASTYTSQIDKKKSSSRDNLSSIGLNTTSLTTQNTSGNNEIDHQAVLYIALYDYKGSFISNYT